MHADPEIVCLLKKLVRIASPSDIAKFVSKLNDDTLRQALVYHNNEDNASLVNFVHNFALELEKPLQKKVRQTTICFLTVVEYL